MGLSDYSEGLRRMSMVRILVEEFELLEPGSIMPAYVIGTWSVYLALQGIRT